MKLRKTLMMLGAGVAMSVLMTANAWAADACQVRSNLGITAAGAASDISGTADKRSDGARQRFKVSVDARVPAGTTYTVHVNGSDAAIGVITIDLLGSGQYESKNFDGETLPIGVDPVCSVSWVEVRSGATVVLSGGF